MKLIIYHKWQVWLQREETESNDHVCWSASGMLSAISSIF